MDDEALSWTRISGVAGIVAALSWIVGDILIVGDIAQRSDFPTLLIEYDARVDVGLAQHLIAIPPQRMIAGALLAVFTLPLYLLGCWHLWSGARPAAKAWAWPAVALIFLGYAWSPLPHAAFYFVGATYHAIASTDATAHTYLLDMAAQFRNVLLITYIPAVGCLALGLFWLSACVATGRTRWPLWFALVVNPLSIGLVTVGLPHVIAGGLGIWLQSAALNTTWLLIYGVSTLLLWRTQGA